MINEIKAYGTHILVIREKADKEKHDLLVPDNYQKKPNRGTILSVGALVHDKSAKKGKIAVFNANVGFVLELPDGEVTVLRETELIGIL